MPAGIAPFHNGIPEYFFAAFATDKKVLGFDLEQLAADLTGNYFRE
jgi:hypothetical protein